MKSILMFTLTGHALMVSGSVLFQAVNSAGYGDLHFWGSFLRVILNFILTLMLYFWPRYHLPSAHILGFHKKYLLVWGVLGSLTIFYYFKSLNTVGVGVSGFLLSCNGAILVLMSACIKKSRTGFMQLMMAVLCLLGSMLLGLDLKSPSEVSGITDGIIAAFCAATAYLLTAQKLARESALSLMFYWSVSGLLIHFLRWPEDELLPPLGFSPMGFLVCAGFSASLGQFLLIRSYQIAQSSLSGILSYSSAIFGVIAEFFIFDQILSGVQLMGVLTILVSNLWVLFNQKWCK